MNEPISFRSVTDLEELDALPDDASILVLDNGTAKQISKANAKFGGGSVTKYTVVEASTQSAQGDVAVQVAKADFILTNEDGSEVTPQEAYDAFMAGQVILEAAATNGMTNESVAYAMGWQGGTTGSGDPTKVNYVKFRVYLNGEGSITIGSLES